MSQTAPLQLLAQDQDDLAVISAALQDAVVKVGDIVFEAKARRLTISLNRFRWEADQRQRVRSALQLGGVLQVQGRKIRRDRRDAVLELLAIGLEPLEAPGGVLTLSFAGGGDLRVTVECVDAVLADISEPWPTPRAPAHEA
ncbi:DUF2948 family protein [uncultured Phenylobacterium sp.]|uniref:DUF2948 family protein n=1 Tax=uncultured Phenylobacterium sp. TaxID=349273 RepID=UPI0025E270D0|nr:DUF2948 family protein [uncultured Phenylobacterium sp.]